MTSVLTRSRATGRITLTDVAQAAGVSPITVSRALRGERAVDPALVKRVQAAARQLGYVPDPAARALASQRSSHVAVLIPLLSNALFVDLLEAVQRSLRPAGYQTLHLMELASAPGVYSVGFSQADAGAEMTRHLLGRGRRRIAFAAAQLDARTLQRLQGWRRELDAAGLYDPKLEWLDPAPSSIALGARMFEQIIREQPDVDAVFFCNDDLAQGALLAALRLSIAVPQRVAVAGFNDLTGSDQMLPPLTTVRTPRAEIGHAAARMLLSLMNGETVASPCVDLGYELVVRAST